MYKHPVCMYKHICTCQHLYVYKHNACINTVCINISVCNKHTLCINISVNTLYVCIHTLMFIQQKCKYRQICMYKHICVNKHTRNTRSGNCSFQAVDRKSGQERAQVGAGEGERRATSKDSRGVYTTSWVLSCHLA